MRYFIIDVTVIQAIRHSCKIIRKNQPFAKMILKEFKTGKPDQYPVYRNARGLGKSYPKIKNRGCGVSERASPGNCIIRVRRLVSKMSRHFKIMNSI
jgi:hypothetical protein